MNYIGELSALAAALLWSFSSFLFTNASIRLGSIQLNIDRMIMALILLGLTIPFLGVSYSLSNYQIIQLSISGFVGLVIGDTFLFQAFKEIGPRVSMLIMASNPAIASILAYFFLDEVLTGWNIIGILVTMARISMVILEKRRQAEMKFPITAMGILYGFLAAAGQGTGLIFAKFAYVAGDVNSLVATFVRIAAAVIFMIPIGIILKRYKNPLKIYPNDAKSFGMISLGSVIGPYLGITFSFLAIIYTKVGIASTFMSTTPIIMLPLSLLFYNEKLSFRAVVGAFVAVGGVAMLFLL